jgi:low temperature requirement protein LtrA
VAPQIRIRMNARSSDELHRASSQLELLFDLTFVIAIASLTSRFAHAIGSGHAVEATVPFLQVFFAIWWAWVNFTWFASSFDTDDVPFRLLTLVQMAGVLVLAAGVPAALDHGDYAPPHSATGSCGSAS